MLPVRAPRSLPSGQFGGSDADLTTVTFLGDKTETIDVTADDGRGSRDELQIAAIVPQLTIVRTIADPVPTIVLNKDTSDFITTPTEMVIYLSRILRAQRPAYREHFRCHSSYVFKPNAGPL